MQEIQMNTNEVYYLKAATEFHYARIAYDHKKGNKAYDKMMRAAKLIRLNNFDAGERFFSSLITSDLAHVATAAAFNLIPLNPKLARTTLQELAKGEAGEARIDAEITLQEWDAGRLDPNWFMD